ncbi:hypothetical protein F5Y09DRAFT_353672 [Xylaria sp. FL1042]|nr:hypothetical protein F5Y09DRAFT_353672 [Xylaria sp. FL1042]
MLLGMLEGVPDYTRHEIVSCVAGDVLKLIPSPDLEYEEEDGEEEEEQEEEEEKEEEEEEYSEEDQEEDQEATVGLAKIKSDREVVDFLGSRINDAFKESLEARNQLVPDLDGDYPQGSKFTWRLAASRGSRAAFETLLSKGIPIDGETRPTLIEIAALHGNVEIVALLLDWKAAVGHALQCAVKADREDIIRLLLSKQPRLAIDKLIDVPNLLDDYECSSYEYWPCGTMAVDSPLALAFAWGNEYIIEVLLEHSRLVEWPEPSAALVLKALEGNKSNV